MAALIGCLEQIHAEVSQGVLPSLGVMAVMHSQLLTHLCPLETSLTVKQGAFGSWMFNAQNIVYGYSVNMSVLYKF